MRRWVGAAFVVACFLAWTLADARAGDWTGAYVGGHAGITAADLPVDYSDGTKWDGLGFRGGEVGAFVGYNWQISRSWVVGLEVDGTWLGLDNTDFDGTRNANIDWTASITGRAGYLVGPKTLVYGKLGYLSPEQARSEPLDV